MKEYEIEIHLNSQVFQGAKCSRKQSVPGSKVFQEAKCVRYAKCNKPPGHFETKCSRMKVGKKKKVKYF